jgi:hypothetical protein
LQDTHQSSRHAERAVLHTLEIRELCRERQQFSMKHREIPDRYCTHHYQLTDVSEAQKAGTLR